MLLIEIKDRPGKQSSFCMGYPHLSHPQRAKVSQQELDPCLRLGFSTLLERAPGDERIERHQLLALT